MTTEEGAESPPVIVLRSAESTVEIRYVERGATTSVLVSDAATGDHTTLDATELESLARGHSAELRRLLTEIAGEDHGPP